MNLEWGKVNFREEIENGISSFLHTSRQETIGFSFEHLKSGFTDNVFLVKVRFPDSQPRIFIAKEYLEDWHQKEKNIYQDILQKNRFLGAPTLVATADGFIILEYLDSEHHAPLSAHSLGLLQDWLTKKHKFFREHPEFVDRFTEDEQIQINYLVKKPLKLLAKLKTTGVKVPDGLETLELFFTDIVKNNNRLPQTLEHGDLEPQNLLVEDNQTLRVLDWVNTRRGSGLFDINQFFETAKDLGVNLDLSKTIRIFTEITGLENLESLLAQVRIIMLLNKIHFYGEKYLKGEEYSFSKFQSIHTLLNGFINELNVLIKNQQKPLPR